MSAKITDVNYKIHYFLTNSVDLISYYDGDCDGRVRGWVVIIVKPLTVNFNVKKSAFQTC